ncbi:Gluconolactonase [Cyphellophora attinorum]|uniref:Gluconolactonase n=1 Tax=Cyphellophora attinorum TaxID=1664694 RepID=A0A0N1I0F1_9EURO|nr:Gluconolactonase [Phialophora attinorum]KPI44945.1 Gluconolactonase [Phialophora attinorum]
MNFYSPPPVIKASLHVKIPDAVRCSDESEWRGGFAGGYQNIFLEGPTILKVDKDKNVTRCIKYDGEPNGMAIRADGKFVVADYKQGMLLFDPSTNQISPLLTRKNLERFKGPNDVIVSSKNEIYFTDQGQTSMTDQTGRVYRLHSDGTKIDMLVANGVSPNGLVLSPDERFLYVAMTRSNEVWRLPLHEDGSTSKVGVFFRSFGNAGPDGLAMDEEGSLFVCHPSLGAVFVVDKHGLPKVRIDSGTDGINLTNCTFGGPEGKTLFITDSLLGNVQTVEWHCRGAGFAR